MAIANRLLQWAFPPDPPQVDIVQPPVKRDFILQIVNHEEHSIVFAASKSLALSLHRQYGTGNLKDWLHPNTYELQIDILYDFYEVVRYINLRYGQ